jgi:dienelactone hydrolase
MRTIALLVFCLAAQRLAAATTVTTIEYASEGATCVGTLVADDAWKAPRAGVLVTHDWMGSTERTQRAAENLAKLGYVAFCADVYGKGVRPANTDEAAKQAGIYKADRKLMRARMQAALTTMLGTGKVDAKRVGAIGYCFGGTCALELARAGAPVAATVTFHGGLATPTPDDARNIVGKVLALHGADDPYVKPDEVAAFEQEMRAAKVDWQLVAYGNAVHGFTHEGAGTDNSKGYAYNAAAARRSWQAMGDFFAEVLGAP